MATTLQLKKRPVADATLVQISRIKAYIENEDKEGLFKHFSGIGNPDFYIHDRRWLEAVVNWVPDGGLPLTEVAKWMKLAKRIGELDMDREGDFTLSDFQVELIHKRLMDPRFKVERMSVPFMEFIHDFVEASGRHFPEEDAS